MTKTYEENGAVYRSRIAAMAHYQRSSYCGFPAQDEFRERIRAKGKVDGWRRVTERFVFQHTVLSPSELISGLVGAEREEAVRQVKSAQGMFLDPVEPVPPEELIQSCFAWPRAAGFIGDRCSACPQERACANSAN